LNGSEIIGGAFQESFDSKQPAVHHFHSAGGDSDAAGCHARAIPAVQASTAGKRLRLHRAVARPGGIMQGVGEQVDAVMPMKSMVENRAVPAK